MHCQQCMRVPVASHQNQPLIAAFLVLDIWYLNVVLIWTS